MSREIEFRVWHRELKRFAPDNCDILLQGEDPYVAFDTFNVNFSTELWYLEDCDLLQYTGLKDKNGVKIFEGDIVEFTSYSGNHSQLGSVTILQIAFTQGGFFTCFKNGGRSVSVFDALVFSSASVIGNIYENPELLEGI